MSLVSVTGFYTDDEPSINTMQFSLARIAVAGNMICLKVCVVLPCLVLFDTQLKMVGIY